MSLKDGSWSKSGVERLGFSLTIAFLTMYSAFCLFVFWLFFWGTDKDVLNRLVSPNTFKLVGTLYEELRFHVDALYLPVIFMLERIVFAVLAVHWRSTLG